MRIKKVVAGVYGANCYILMDEVSKETAVIDPGGDAEELINAIVTLGGKVKFILFTHGHLDHVGGAEALQEYFKVPLYIHREDGKLIASSEKLFGAETLSGAPLKFERYISEGDIFSIGDTEIKCIETPGHTPGGMCFLIDGSVFTGDTLFLNSIGRTDFTGGDYETLIQSIKIKLMSLDNTVIVYPGHGPSSTVEKERAHNPFIRS